MSPPIPLIIDTDPGVDDLLAILLALGSPEVSIEAVTLNFGNTTLDYAHSNVLRLAHALDVACYDNAIENPVLVDRIKNGMNGRPIPVGLGASKPLGGRLFTASYFHGRDGMSGVSFMEGDPYPESKTSKLFHTSPSPLSAADLILDILRKHEPHTVRIAAVAPLTNLALAYQKDPVTFRRVGMISIMGGAIDVPGNTSPTAEFNFFADPWAAKVLLVDSYYQGTPLPIHLFPLDTTTVHTVPYSKLVLDETHSLYQKSYLVRLISLFLRKPRAVTNSHAPHDKPFDPSKYDLFEAHDPLAVAHAIFGSDTERWGANPRQFLIETEGQLTRGFCVVDRRDLGKDYTGRFKTDVASVQGSANEVGSSQGTSSQETLDDESHLSEPVPTISVIHKTPGSLWFANMMLGRIGMGPVLE